MDICHSVSLLNKCIIVVINTMVLVYQCPCLFLLASPNKDALLSYLDEVCLSIYITHCRPVIAGWDLSKVVNMMDRGTCIDRD